jgi:hypothetical protein
MRNIAAKLHCCSLLGTSLALVTLTAASQVNLGTTQVSTLGHSTFYDVLLGITDVHDLLVGAGAASLPSLSVNFDINNQFVITISAPPGERFLVQPPAGQTVSLQGRLQWDGPNPTGAWSPGTVSLSFGDPVGTPPTLDPSSASILAINHGFFGWNVIQSSGFTSPFSFSSITLTGTVPSSNAGLGTLPYAQGVDSALAFSYSKSGPGDPGSFVSIVPEPPTLSLMIFGSILLVGAACKNGRKDTKDGRPEGLMAEG